MLKIEPFLKKFSRRVFVKLSQRNSPRKWCVVSWMNKHMCAHSHRSNSSAYSCRRPCNLVLSIRSHSLSFTKKLTSWLTKLLSWLTQSLPFKKRGSTNVNSTFGLKALLSPEGRDYACIISSDLLFLWCSLPYNWEDIFSVSFWNSLRNHTCLLKFSLAVLWSKSKPLACSFYSLYF